MEDIIDDTHEALSQPKVTAIIEAVSAQDRDTLRELLLPMHAADVAQLLEQISSTERSALLSLYSDEIDGDILSEISESIREEVIDLLPREIVAEAIRDLDTDDVVDILEDLDAPAQAELLSTLESRDRMAVEKALSYPENSAGRLMQREMVIAPLHWSVGEAIDHIRQSKNLPDQFYHIILVDPRMKPVAYVTLGHLLSSRRNVPLLDLGEDGFRTILVTAHEADAAYLFNHYHIISCPVVDENERLVGVITIDDAMNVLDEEHAEALLHLGGVDAEASLSDTVFEAAKGRSLWLGVNLLTAILASLVIDLFANSIQSMVALAVLMPIVASMGGNAGTQSMTVAVRALATRDLTSQNAPRIIRRELAVGVINGVVFGAIMAFVTGFWFGVPMLAVVIAMAMLMTLVAAALGGILIPIMLDRFNIDPAVASGPFVTTVTDVVGFFVFLGLSAWILL